MSLFSVFQSLWSSTPALPAVNIDGTPMVNDAVDVFGKAFGVTASMDMTGPYTDHDLGSNCSSFSSDPWCSLE